MAVNFIVNQFEIGNDAKGSARAAAWIQLQLQGGFYEEVLGVARYDRESGAAFLVIIMGSSNTSVGQPTADGTVGAITTEIESGGVATLAAALNAAYALSVHLKNVVSFTVSRRESGSAYATVIISS
jgi:energy-converting hydrogenase Eha subunit E